MPGARTYTLVGPDGAPYESPVKGAWGGHRRSKIYGRLDCPTALRYLTKGQYADHRVFFMTEDDAIEAGFRPCASCCPERYRAWKAGRKDGLGREASARRAREQVGDGQTSRRSR